VPDERRFDSAWVQAWLQVWRAPYNRGKRPMAKVSRVPASKHSDAAADEGPTRYGCCCCRCSCSEMPDWTIRRSDSHSTTMAAGSRWGFSPPGAESSHAKQWGGMEP